MRPRDAFDQSVLAETSEVAGHSALSHGVRIESEQGSHLCSSPTNELPNKVLHLPSRPLRSITSGEVQRQAHEMP